MRRDGAAKKRAVIGADNSMNLIGIVSRVIEKCMTLGGEDTVGIRRVEY
jgi:hypothetical protein